MACPRCGAALAATVPGSGRVIVLRCPNCRATYRSVIMASLFSMALPGAGHYYLKRPILASLELGGGLILLGRGVLDLLAIFPAVVDGEKPSMALMTTCVPWALILAAYSMCSGGFTWLVSRRRLVPTADDGGPGTGTQSAGSP